jgi:hypothetical protein
MEYDDEDYKQLEKYIGETRHIRWTHSGGRQNSIIVQGGEGETR